MTFNDLGLSRPVLEAVQKLGFELPTPIQAQAIPLLMQGHDVIGSAQTGTGKTAAFALPILSQLATHAREPRALVLAPTRELATQIEEAIGQFARGTGLRVAAFYGGVGYGRQIAALRKGVDIVVATPGRLLDHLNRGTLKLAAVRYLVLDEADRMLDMGFLPDVRRILSGIPVERQTSLFSATIPPQIHSLIKWAMKTPRTVQIGQSRSPADTVKHILYPVAQEQKVELLQKLLNNVSVRGAIVFCRTKRGADRIGRVLEKGQNQVAVLHGDRSQRERDQALDGFRRGHVKVLIATDLAARGLDVPEVSHVINFDVPHHPEDYVHRIGRTGRAEATGDAFTIMAAEDSDHVHAIERFIGKKIDKAKVPDFDYQYTRLFEAETRGSNPPRRGGVRGARLVGGYFYGHSKRR